jgi:methylglyoxal synthase
VKQSAPAGVVWDLAENHNCLPINFTRSGWHPQSDALPRTTALSCLIMTDSSMNSDASHDNASDASSSDELVSQNSTSADSVSADGSTKDTSPIDEASGETGRVAPRAKRIALVAHDNKKPDLLSWARYNRESLAEHRLIATGTTGRILEEELGISIKRLQSGPLGGDQQLGAMISEGDIDMLIFFWDPLEQMPHDPDVKALLRIAVAWNIPIACNRTSADFLISSPLFTSSYERQVPDFADYRERTVQT